MAGDKQHWEKFIGFSLTKYLRGQGRNDGKWADLFDLLFDKDREKRWGGGYLPNDLIVNPIVSDG